MSYTLILAEKLTRANYSPLCVQAGKEGCVHLIKSESDLLVFLVNFFFNIVELEKIEFRPQLLLGFFF